MLGVVGPTEGWRPAVNVGRARLNRGSRGFHTVGRWRSTVVPGLAHREAPSLRALLRWPFSSFARWHHIWEVSLVIFVPKESHLSGYLFVYLLGFKWECGSSCEVVSSWINKKKYTYVEIIIIWLILFDLNRSNNDIKLLQNSYFSTFIISCLLFIRRLLWPKT